MCLPHARHCAKHLYTESLLTFPFSYKANLHHLLGVPDEGKRLREVRQWHWGPHSLQLPDSHCVQPLPQLPPSQPLLFQTTSSWHLCEVLSSQVKVTYRVCDVVGLVLGTFVITVPAGTFAGSRAAAPGPLRTSLSLRSQELCGRCRELGFQHTVTVFAFVLSPC